MHYTAEISFQIQSNESKSHLATSWQGTRVLRKSKQYKRKRRKHTTESVDPMNGDRNDRLRDCAKRTVPIRIGFCNATHGCIRRDSYVGQMPRIVPSRVIDSESC
jgi:hypothetical protein